MATQKSQKRNVLFSGCLFHIYHDSIADGLAVLLPFWKAAFHLSLAQVGLVITCFEGATALFQVPAGFLGERYGERRLLTLGTIVSAGCFIAIAFVDHIYALCALLIVGGLGAGVQHPLAASMISRSYEHENRRIVLGTYNFSGDMGKFLFPAVAAIVLTFAGWRTLCFGYGVSGLILAMGLYMVLRHNLAGGIAIEATEKSGKTAGWGIEKKRAFALLSGIGFVDTAVRTALITFLPFLLISKGMAMEKTGLALSLLFIGGALGKFLCGIMAEKIGIIPSITIPEAITGLGILYLFAMPLSAVLPFLPLLGIALNGTSSVLYGTVADFVSPSHVPRAFGLFYTVIISAAAVAPPVFGVLSDAKGVDFTIFVVAMTAFITLPLAFMLSNEIRSIQNPR
ncbi:MAG: MFS transporter [Deltaproteobacteria bacterium]|nr:MFS transporter [Deltaproteobacteria bacterium]